MIANHMSTVVIPALVGTRNQQAGMGKLVKAARLREGWTQAQLGQRLGGVDKSYVSQIETGVRRWPQEHIRKLADVLGLSQVEMAIAAGLIDRPAEMPMPFNDNTPSAKLCAHVQRRGLTEEERKVIVGMLQITAPRRDGT